MSQIHIEKFYQIAANDQALQGQLIGDTSSPEQFIENSVAAAKERGLNFSAEEANTWIAAQQATKANGELSDTQLEGVAGGKGFDIPIPKCPDWYKSIGDTVGDAGSTVGGGIDSGFQKAGDWFSSW
jgi:predicted ribosomally synthesized peptide with nif11-like leader